MLEKDIINEKCTELFEAGLIEPCTDTTYAANPTIAAKKDASGAWTDKRFCIDYRSINEATTLDRYQMHDPQELFDQLGASTFFSKIDLRAGFHQMPIAESDRSKTAFHWNGQLWQYARMPFGLKNAPSYFQRVVDFELAKAGLSNATVSFIDDI